MPHFDHAAVFDASERRREVWNSEGGRHGGALAIASVYSAGIWSGFWLYTKSNLPSVI
jgi:hypothetical protein